MIEQACEQHPQLSVRHLCEVLQVNRSWYYQRSREDEVQDTDMELRDAIERVVLDFSGYGYRRVTKALQREGRLVNHKRVLRIMREEALLCHLKGQFVHTTDSHHRYQTYSNLLHGQELTAPDQAWVADLTSIRLPKTFVYLASLLDAYSRKCIGWKLSERIDSYLALGALEAALATREVKVGLIHHSDRGVQYASTAYGDRLKSVGIHVSMSAQGNPYDNAKAESFFKTLKREEVYLKRYETLEEAQANIGTFIEDVYNTKRLHSSLGYVPPCEFEMAYALANRTSL